MIQCLVLNFLNVQKPTSQFIDLVRSIKKKGRYYTLCDPTNRYRFKVSISLNFTDLVRPKNHSRKIIANFNFKMFLDSQKHYDLNYYDWTFIFFHFNSNTISIYRESKIRHFFLSHEK